MDKKIKIVIAGDGFAGINVLPDLVRYKKKLDLDITLIGKGSFEFLPLLPQIIASEINAKDMTWDYEKIFLRKGIRIVKAFVKEVNPEHKTVTVDNGERIHYDYLAVTCGSLPVFELPGALKMTDKTNACEIKNRILEIIASGKKPVVSVIGGGYTGIELITAIKKLCLKNKVNDPVLYLIERNKEIIGNLPEYIKKAVNQYLKRLGVKVLVGADVRTEEKKIICGDTIIENDLLAVSAGVKGGAGDLFKDYADPRTKRIKVDEFLMASENVFCAGDAAYIDVNGMPLRQGAFFSIRQGMAVSKNIIRLIMNRKPVRYDIFDPGYFVPVFAVNKAPGILFGIKFKGSIGFLLHNIINIYLSMPFTNKLRLLCSKIFGNNFEHNQSW